MVVSSVGYQPKHLERCSPEQILTVSAKYDATRSGPVLNG